MAFFVPSFSFNILFCSKKTLSAFESGMVKYSLYTKAMCSLEGVLAHPHLKGGDA